jgi:hypothetical protein
MKSAALVLMCWLLGAHFAIADEMRTISSSEGPIVRSGWLAAGECAADPAGQVTVRVGGGVFSLPSDQIEYMLISEARQVTLEGASSTFEVPHSAGCPESPLPVAQVSYRRQMAVNVWPILLEMSSSQPPTHEARALLDLRERVAEASTQRTLQAFEGLALVNVVGGCFALPASFRGCTGLEGTDGQSKLVLVAFDTRADKVQASGAPIHTKCVFVMDGDARAAVANGALSVRRLDCGLQDQLSCGARFQTVFPAPPTVDVVEPALTALHDYFQSISQGGCR